jgi:REP element-mobilizing transposase RayT
MSENAYRLSRDAAKAVLRVLREVCAVRSWQLIAAHIRSTHVHCVVGGVVDPNRAIADFKAYASRALNRDEPRRKRWAREGSTRRLSTPESIQAAVRYVADKQGEPMTVYVARRGADDTANPDDPRPYGTGL